jgi:hypothetical protein
MTYLKVLSVMKLGCGMTYFWHIFMTLHWTVCGATKKNHDKPVTTICVMQSGECLWGMRQLVTRQSILVNGLSVVFISCMIMWWEITSHWTKCIGKWPQCCVFQPEIWCSHRTEHYRLSHMHILLLDTVWIQNMAKVTTWYGISHKNTNIQN